MENVISIRGQQCPASGCEKSAVWIHGQKRKRLKCASCGRTWSALSDDPRYGLRSSAEKIDRARELLLQKISIRKIARFVGVSASTVARWKKRFQFFPPTRE